MVQAPQGREVRTEPGSFVFATSICLYLREKLFPVWVVRVWSCLPNTICSIFVTFASCQIQHGSSLGSLVCLTSVIVLHDAQLCYLSQTTQTITGEENPSNFQRQESISVQLVLPHSSKQRDFPAPHLSPQRLHRY